MRNEHRRRAHKSSSKFFSNAKHQQDILYVFGDKASDGESGSSGAYYRNRKREKKDFEKVYEYRVRSYIFVILHAQFYLLSKMRYILWMVALLQRYRHIFARKFANRGFDLWLKMTSKHIALLHTREKNPLVPRVLAYAPL